MSPEAPDTGLLKEVCNAVRPMMEKLQSQITVLDEKLEGMRELNSQAHRNTLETVKRIEQQTIRTNGRVGELEKKEILNKFARAGLYAVAGMILYAVLTAVLSKISL